MGVRTLSATGIGNSGTLEIDGAALSASAWHDTSLTDDAKRTAAQFGALYQLSLTLVGATLGPLAVGLVTDRLLGDEARIGESLSLVSALVNPIAAVLLWLALKKARARPSAANS